MLYNSEFESRFPLQTPRSNVGRFCLWAAVWLGTTLVINT